MALFHISTKVIEEYLGIKWEFANAEEFCEFLLKNAGKPNITVGLKKMLVSLTAGNEKARQTVIKSYFDARVKWFRQNCSIDGLAEEKEDKELSGDKCTEVPDVVPESDFAKVKQEFEGSGYLKVQPLEEEEMDYTEGIVLHEGGVITLQDKVQIFLSKDGLSVDTSKILIVEEKGNQVLALGHLLQRGTGDEDFTVIFDNKSFIDYEKFSDIHQVRFVIFDQKGNAFGRVVDMDFEPFAVERERPLCIDFGTSNTAAGSYGIRDRQKDEAEIVHFIDVTAKNSQETQISALLPTIVYVEDCSDANDIKYLFGYEARKKIEEEHYESKASVYYEIKRWISSADEPEEVRDNKNCRAYPLKKEIIKAYLDYVIENAEQYFGTRFEKIHFTAPVKLKERFIDVLSQLYKNEKQVIAVQDSIDEGIAIVYNQIIALLYAFRRDEGQGGNKKSIMIMDCGGGTTDLASCEYSYRKDNAGLNLILETCFENGNSNFGGNNITYRIMQLLKIKIAALLRDNYIDFQGEVVQLIDKSENDILGLVERQAGMDSYDSDRANDEVYAKFLENYQRAETVIPTIYTGNETYAGTESLKQIKRNFHYLWRQAEQIKIDFYKTDRVLMDFKDDVSDTQIPIKYDPNYYLYAADKESRKLKKLSKPFHNVSITIKEINRVICGDIYSLLVGLFKNENEKGELISAGRKVDSFDYYKLSGQSCKISLFSELIKEYIPGRKLRPAIKSGSAGKRKAEELKLDCVLGSINYMKDQLRPEMRVILNAKMPEIIYNVILKGTHAEDKKLFDCLDINVIHFEVCHKNTKECPLKVTGEDNVTEREFIFGLKNYEADKSFWDTDEIRNKIRDYSIVSEAGINDFINALQDTVRESTELVNVVFAVPSKFGYGVYIGQIQGCSTEDRSEYKLLRFKYENFEDASKTFFDGRR